MRLLDVHKFEILSDLDDATAAVVNDEVNAQRKLWDIEPSTSKASYGIPPYVILSHRWVGQEVIFQDFESVPKAQLQSVPRANPVPNSTKGTADNTGQGSVASVYKIAGACAEVRKRNTGIHHIWIDTVCINKLEPRELSSAINSMFKYYHNATACYVYLYDVVWNMDDQAESGRQFLQSKWFTRGWTLQELLAPKKLEFFDRDWRYIGSKQRMADYIREATGILEEHLLIDFRQASIAQKMSWLSRRTTSIIEDRAYCMLGLFGVFLDARYGRGADEFLRLQREIFNSFPPGVPIDESLFAWKTDVIESSGLLAPAPSCFRDMGQILFEPRLSKSRVYLNQPGMRMDANYVIDFHVPCKIRDSKGHRAAIQVGHMLTFGTATAATYITNTAVRRSKSEHLVNLNCWVRGPGKDLRCVRIKVVQDKDKTWRRIECDRLYESDNADLHSQADVHGSRGRLYFPNQVRYRA